MESLDHLNKSIKELIVKSVLLDWYAKLIVGLGFLTPLVFLLSVFTSLNIIIVLTIFITIALFLRIQYVRSVNRRKINSHLIRKLKAEKNLLIHNIFGN